MRRVRQPARLDRRAELAREVERRAGSCASTPGSMPSPVSSSGTPRRMPFRSVARRQRDRLGQAERGRVRRVAALHRAQQQRGVGDVARERPGLVERGGEGDHPVAADRAVGGLEADDPAQRGGLADRAAGVGADRPRREAGGDGGGAAAARAAGDARAVPRVQRRAVGGVLGRRAHRELVLVGLAEHRRAGGLQSGAPTSRCTAGGSPRGSSSRPGSGCPRCRRGP